MKRTIIDASQLELTEKVVSIKRVTKVVKGGRNFRFAALVVVGDGNGHVGAGLGKATEIPEAIRKGKEDAIKKLIEVPVDENGSVTHDNLGKFGSATVYLNSLLWVLVSSPVARPVRFSNLPAIRISVQNLWVPVTNRMLYLQPSMVFQI